MNTDDHVRLVLWISRPLYRALLEAAKAADQPMPDFMRGRLASSLTVPHAAARTGVAGRGGVARSASPGCGA